MNFGFRFFQTSVVRGAWCASRQSRAEGRGPDGPWFAKLCASFAGSFAKTVRRVCARFAETLRELCEGWHAKGADSQS